MTLEIPVYTLLDDVYLYENESFHYNRETGEIFIHGREVGMLIGNYSYLDIALGILRDGLKKYSEKEIEDYPTLKYIYNKYVKGLEYPPGLITLHMINGYTPVHNIYIILRTSKYGFIHTLNTVMDYGYRWIYRRYIEYLRWRKFEGYKPRTNYIWKSYKEGKLPRWQEHARRIIKKYITENMADISKDYLDLDKKFRSLVRKLGYTPFEAYTFYLCEAMNFSIKDIVYPKLLMSEAVYIDYTRKSGKEIILYPLYRGELIQSASPEIL